MEYLRRELSTHLFCENSLFNKYRNQTPKVRHPMTNGTSTGRDCKLIQMPWSTQPGGEGRSFGNLPSSLILLRSHLEIAVVQSRGIVPDGKNEA